MSKKIFKKKKKKLIFLDRDGVINKYPGDGKYVTSAKQFYFLPRAPEAIRRLTEAGYAIFIVSNQTGVKKRLYSKNALDNITKKMLKKIEETKGKISAVYYCLHAQEDNCSCRKPKTGLIKKALAQLKIKKLKSREVFFIGDDMRDVHTGKNADLRTILVLSGREKLKNQKKWTLRPDYVFQDLCQAVDFILSL